VRPSVILSALLVAFCQHAAPQTYTIRTVAGTSYAGDGLPATSAVLLQPEGIAFDALGNMYIADAADNRVRKVDSAGRISTIAGDGSASTSALNAPYDVCVDLAGNVYIADMGNARVLKIARNGVISTVAGGPDAKIALVQPRNVAVDNRGIVYISDFGANRIYQLASDGALTLLAGTGEPGISEDGVLAIQSKLSGPAGLTIDIAGNIYVADSGNKRVRRISAGMMRLLRDSSGRPIEFGTVSSVAVDRSLNVYVADGGSVVTRIGPAGEIGFVSSNARSVSIDNAGRLYTAAGDRVQRVDNASITPIAGSGLGAFAGDGGPPSQWRFSGPSGIVRDSAGDIYIADSGSGRVRQITARGDLITLIGGLQRPSALALDSAERLYVADAGDGKIHRYEKGVVRVFSSGTTGKPFARPSALAFNASGDLFVADTGNNLIRKITPAGVVTVVAGGGGSPEDTQPLRARLAEPAGIGFDSSGNLWFSEAGTGWLRRLSPTGELLTLKLDLKEPRGLKTAADGSVYVCETGAGRVVQVMPDGKWWPIAGNGEPGSSDTEMPALDASMMQPVDLWLSPNGRILIADAAGARIRELVPTEAVIPPPAPITQTSISAVHAATLAEQEFAPGQLVVIRGEGLVDDTVITVDGRPSVKLSVKKNEIIAQMPPAIATGVVELALSYHGKENAKTAVTIAASAPGLFAVKGGSGQVIAVNEHGTLNSADDPAPRGSVVSLYGTGQGVTEIAATVTISGIDAEVLYAGPAPGQAGVFQINARTPSGFAPSGVVPLAVTINGKSVQTGLTIVTR
jgi:trimeric autotransporter adhesin